MTQVKSKNSILKISSLILTLTLILSLATGEVFAGSKDTLWLKLAPPGEMGPACDSHEAPPAAPAKVSGRPASGRPGGGASGHSQHSQGSQRFESEHRPTPVRTYYLDGPSLSPDAEAYVLHPDGSSKELELQYRPEQSVTLKTPMAVESIHGANFVYVVDKKIGNGVLTVQSAKWLTIHHSCGWGHDYRNDEFRNTAHSLANIPLEIVIDGLWDPNFHANAQSGEIFDILVTSEGKPVEGAKVTVTTEKNWTKTSITGADGIAKVQLIRDYYPSNWEHFNRSQVGSFTVTAEYLKNEVGTFNAQPYEKVQYIATFPWKYSPAQADYNSYAFGLGLGSFSMAFAGLGIYTYRERRKKPYKGIDLE